MIKKIPPEHVFQKAGSENCGPCCLQMIYNLKGINRDLEKILSDLKYPPQGKNTFPGQIATHLLQNGQDCRMYVANTRVVSPAWRDLTREQLISNITEWMQANPKDDWLNFGSSLQLFLKAGGKIDFKSLGPDDFQEMLNRGSQLIPCVEGPLLWDHKFIMPKQLVDEIHGSVPGHYVVVKSLIDGQVEILDPYPTNLSEKNGHYKVSLKDLVNATLVWSGTVIEVFN